MIVLETILRFAVWAAFYLAAARIGRWVTRSSLKGIGHLAWDGLAGLSIVIGAFLLIGLWRFDRPVVWIGVAALCAIGLARRPTRPELSIVGPMIAGVILIGLFWNRVPVLFFDTLGYHYAQPELWLLDGRIQPYSWSLHSWFPPGMSVLYGIGLALGGEAWANDANLMVGVALLFAAHDTARRAFGGRLAWLAPLALLAVPQILFALAIPAADLAHGTFVATTIVALVYHREGLGRHAGWLAAGALLTKWLAVVVPLGLGGLWLLRRGPKRAIAFGLPALLLLAPWFVANTVTVGNPVAPILADALPVEGLAPGGESSFQRDARGGLPDGNDVRALMPHLVGPSESGIYPGPAWGPPILLWIGIALIGALRFPEVRRWTLLFVASFGVWFLTFRWERFLIATTFLLTIAFVGVLIKMPRYGTWIATASLLLALGFVPMTVPSIIQYSGGLDVLLARETPQEMIRRSWPQQALVESVDWEEGDRLLLVGEMRHFRVPVARTAPTGFNLHPLAMLIESDTAPEAISRQLRDQGFTHLLFDMNWIERSAEQYPSLKPLTEYSDRLRQYLISLGPPLTQQGPRALCRIPEAP